VLFERKPKNPPNDCNTLVELLRTRKVTVSIDDTGFQYYRNGTFILKNVLCLLENNSLNSKGKFSKYNVIFLYFMLTYKLSYNLE
jgi:hypothetical protein